MKFLSTLIVLSLVLCIVSAAEPKSPVKPLEERIKDQLKVWEQNWSGFPINCRKMVDTLASDGVVEYPVGKNVISGGHKRIFTRCEAFIVENFSQMQTYISNTPYIVGYNVAFERTTLFMTKNNCRLYSRGIVHITFDKDLKIKTLKDFFDIEDLMEKYEQCQFPGTELPDINAGTEDARAPAAAEVPAPAATETATKQKDEL
eukprot:gene1348-1542_t